MRLTPGSEARNGGSRWSACIQAESPALSRNGNTFSSEARTPAFGLLVFSLVDREAGLLKPDISQYVTLQAVHKASRPVRAGNSFPSGLSSKEAVLFQLHPGPP